MTGQPMLRPRCCPSCPFLGGFHLSHDRRAQIKRAVVERDQSFQCHSEIDYSDLEGERADWVDQLTARQCAGATTLCLRDEAPNQLMRWAGRLGIEPVEDDRVPFDHWDDWLKETIGGWAP